MANKNKKTTYVFTDQAPAKNIGDLDRLGRGVIAAWLLANPSGKRGFFRLIRTGLGVFLAATALTGESATYKSLDIDTTKSASWDQVKKLIER